MVEDGDGFAGFDKDTLEKIGVLLGHMAVTDGVGPALNYATAFLTLYRDSGSPIETHLAGILAAMHAAGRVTVKAQAEILTYRCDFLITHSGFKIPGIVVECDGHAFHERTREQAARDRKRDRDMQNAGYIVLRFTGSEIRSNIEVVSKDLNTAIKSAKGRGNG